MIDVLAWGVGDEALFRMHNDASSMLILTHLVSHWDCVEASRQRSPAAIQTRIHGPQPLADGMAPLIMLRPIIR